MSNNPSRSCFTCRHRFESAELEPCVTCLGDDGWLEYEPQNSTIVARESQKAQAAALGDRDTPRGLLREVFQALQEERDRLREDRVRACERADALERKLDAVEQKLADERQATDDQIAALERGDMVVALERGVREWDMVRRGCGCVDPVWLLAARCLLLSQRREEASERYGWLIGERGDWQLSWNRAHVAATLPTGDPLILVHVDAKDIVARRAETEGADSYRLGLCMWAGPLWAGECQAGTEAAQDLEAELRTWLEDLEGEGVHHG
jgi:hypothetical protein